jgi:hypothetical protein
MFQLLCIHFSSMPRSLAGEKEDQIKCVGSKTANVEGLIGALKQLVTLLWDIEEHELQGPANKQL